MEAEGMNDWGGRSYCRRSPSTLGGAACSHIISRGYPEGGMIFSAACPHVMMRPVDVTGNRTRTQSGDIMAGCVSSALLPVGECCTYPLSRVLHRRMGSLSWKCPSPVAGTCTVLVQNSSCTVLWPWPSGVRGPQPGGAVLANIGFSADIGFLTNAMTAFCAGALPGCPVGLHHALAHENTWSDSQGRREARAWPRSTVAVLSVRLSHARAGLGRCFAQLADALAVVSTRARRHFVQLT